MSELHEIVYMVDLSALIWVQTDWCEKQQKLVTVKGADHSYINFLVVSLGNTQKL